MEPKVGSIIQRGTSFCDCAVHTGIYVGDGKVVHFDGESSSSGKSDEVREVSLSEFAEGKDVFVRKEPKDVSHGERVAKRAKEIKNNPNNGYNGNYGLFFGKHCQDFTADCYNNS